MLDNGSRGQPLSEQEHGPRTVDTVLADRLYAYCQGRGWSAQTLSNEIAKLGGHLGRATISKIWNGDRTVTVDEWLLLAAALNVPPPLLLLPIGESEAVKITERSTIHPHLAYKWVAGLGPLADSKQYAIGIRDWQAAARPLQLYSQHDDFVERVSQADQDVRRAKLVSDDEARAAREAYVDALGALVEHRSLMRETGYPPPEIPDEWVRDAEMLGDVEAEDT